MENKEIIGDSFCFFSSLMQPDGDEYPVDGICEGCKNHKPEWEYRFCRYTECPKMAGFKTFREEYDGGKNGGI